VSEDVFFRRVMLGLYRMHKLPLITCQNVQLLLKIIATCTCGEV
jgi:hypothetical protein